MFEGNCSQTMNRRAVRARKGYEDERTAMDCKEAQRCIHLFLKDELDLDTAYQFVEHISSCSECMEELTVEYLLLEGISRLENAEDIDVQSELEDRLNRTITRKKVYKQLKAGLFLVGSMIVCMFLLGGV